MIADQGGQILAINLEARQVLFQAPDGKNQICDIKQWHGFSGAIVSGPELAVTFAFEVDGFDKNGVPVVVRYDGQMQGVGEAIPRQADGTFGTKAGRRLNDDVQANYGREVIQ